jgi:hypothetical protein
VTGAKVDDGSLTAADIAAPVGAGSLVGSAAVDPPSLPADSCAIATATVTGIQPGDRVILNVDPTLENGLVAQAVPATGANTLDVRVCNTTDAGPIDGAAKTYSYIVIR